MADQKLQSRRVLVVEDEYLLADELAQGLAREDALVLGPVPNVERALAIIADQPGPDIAILDINLGGTPAYRVADELIERGVPFIFATGYDAEAIPDRFAHIPRCEKPVNVQRISELIGRAINS